jgi:2-desacetyl-2-hydroxyethyl bacteriochlorophyllide A dehydrogenase
MDMQTTQIVFTERSQVALETVSLPELGPHDVLVRTEVSGISAGTELTNLLGDMEGQSFPKYPGYSNVGVVEAVGTQVTEFAAGDRVLSNGRHASHHIVRRDPQAATVPQLLLPVPDGVDPADATFTTLGAVAMHGIRKAEPKLGQTAAVVGQGVVGQLLCQLLRLNGVHPTIGIDVFPARLEQGALSGTSVLINAAEEDVVARVMEETDGKGVDLSYDATRSGTAIRTLMDIAAQSGKVLLVGSIPRIAEIPLFDPLQTKELSIIGVLQPRSPMTPHAYYPWTQERNRAEILALLARQALKVDHLITHRMAPAQAPETYDMIARGGSDWLGIVFEW